MKIVPRRYTEIVSVLRSESAGTAGSAFHILASLTLRHRVKSGARLVVPFGTRKLTGVVLHTHNEAPAIPVRDALRLIDPEPVLNDELIALGRWISGYYCAPLGEVLRSMLPLAADIRGGKIYSLTDAGRDAAKQLSIETSAADDLSQLMRMLEARPLTAVHLKRKFPLAANLLLSLRKRGWIAVEDVQQERDPLRSPAAKLRVAATGSEPQIKLVKAERELLAFLDLHPGTHNLGELEATVRNASNAARSLARKSLVTLVPEPMAIQSGLVRVPHDLNGAQRKAFDLIAAGLESHKFCTFLLHGVTGSGKTEVYLNAIDTALHLERSALLLVPEIALTPAMAGQFYSRFGDRVAILHSAFSDTERAEQWRRFARAGRAWWLALVRECLHPCGIQG